MGRVRGQNLKNGKVIKPKETAPKPRGKGMHIEIQLKTQEIAKKFAEGYSTDEIIDWVVNTYGVSEERAYRDIVRVFGLFKERTKEELDTLHKRISSMYLHLYRQALEDGDRILALKTLELYSNFASNKDIININVVNDTQVNLNLEAYSDEDLEKLLSGDTVKIIGNSND
ncbi:hypothetical protein EHR02_00075 [Leptospira levettii]|uniref:hypothetical protein n=1 Tax=Leptospira levettii TaxID=2023178 RepID=UPI001083D8DE|nr:hypothetical protein [Leptospira levettii]TGM95034.1 hypothetical protein EHR02_00075 [Leptospira levettii]